MFAVFLEVLRSVGEENFAYSRSAALAFFAFHNQPFFQAWPCGHTIT